MKPSDIHYPTMVEALIKPGADILKTLTEFRADAWHMATGVAGEAGELLDAIQASYFDGAPFDRVNVVEEMGDLEFYLEGVRQRYSLERVVPVGELAHVGMMDGAVRLCVAACDLLDVIKKEVAYDKPIDLDRLKTVLETIEAHLQRLRVLVNIAREETLEANVVKLYLGNAKNKARYPAGKFTNKDAQARADKQALVTPRGSLGEEVSA